MIYDRNLSSGECYGNYNEKECHGCEFAESCQYSSNGDNDNSGKVRNAVEYNKNEFRLAECNKSSKHGSECSKIEYLSYLQMAEFTTTLLTADDTTFRMIKEVLNNPHTTQSDIARKFGVTRQRVHSAIIEVCQKDNRLANLFLLLMKRSTLANNIDKKDISDNNDNLNQQQLF